MVETYDTIILGHVDRAEVRYPPASVHPNGYRVEKPPETVSTVTVLHVISAPRIRQDQQISFVQAGGATKDGTQFQVAGDLLVEVGQTYLMFLNDLSFSRGLDEFIGPPFGRFLVREDSMVMPNGWDGELGVGAVSGVTREEVLAARYSENPEVALAAYAKTNVEEAASRILAAIAEAPLPPPPTPVPSGDASPAPSDQPTLTPAAEAVAHSAAP
jgi:hypothetical protein